VACQFATRWHWVKFQSSEARETRRLNQTGRTFTSAHAGGAEKLEDATSLAHADAATSPACAAILASPAALHNAGPNPHLNWTACCQAHLAPAQVACQFATRWHWVTFQSSAARETRRLNQTGRTFTSAHAGQCWSQVSQHWLDAAGSDAVLQWFPTVPIRGSHRSLGWCWL